ncbi:MAG: 16S rRNA (guanine(527)-N(7))-methyltransferase RsmG, partial [Spirochaetia bacterium]|nr:16S rRNA (guanine(527)-N(7))-methyltransferase RsmG [Spirochaetia bacterium]
MAGKYRKLLDEGLSSLSLDLNQGQR